MEWENVATDTWRLRVPGGWLYRFQESMCFVPSTDQGVTDARRWQDAQRAIGQPCM